MLNQNKVPFEENHPKFRPPTLKTARRLRKEKKRKEAVYPSPWAAAGGLGLPFRQLWGWGSGRSRTSVSLPSATIPHVGPPPPRKWPQMPGPLKAVRTELWSHGKHKHRGFQPRAQPVQRQHTNASAEALRRPICLANEAFRAAMGEEPDSEGV